MSKINIEFNGKSFSFDEAALSEAKSSIKEHLLSTMSGSGATIKFDGVSYGIDLAKLSAAEDNFASYLDTLSGETPDDERLEGDGAEYYTLAPTALSFRSTAPLNELQEVQINGVTVDPANYTLEEGSTIVTFPIEYLKTLEKGNYEVDVVSTSKTVKGGFTVAAPELNEYGFYYHQPYVGYVSYYNQNWVFFLREDGTMDFMILDDGYTETCNYEMDGSNITVNGAAGTFTGFVSATEIYCNEVATNFVLGDTSIVADDDYIYIYKEELGGYEVKAIDKTKTEYGAIKTGINGMDTVKLADEAFTIVVDGVQQNPNLIRTPEIPDGVIIIGNMAFRGCINLTSITIPDSVTSIGYYAFNGCSSLTSVTIGNSVASIGEEAFSGCSSLTSIEIPDSVTSIGNHAFKGCSSLTSIVIPNSVTSIGGYAFSDCSSLTSVTIGNSVKSINGVFNHCTSLTNITYNGTIAQWNAITKSDNWNYNAPATYVQCSDGQVAL